MDGIMNTVANNINTTYSAAPAKSETTEKPEEKTQAAETTAKGLGDTPAATFEKSSDDQNTVTAKTPAKRSEADRTALIAQMKADMEQQKSQLLKIVQDTMTGQGTAFAIATDDDSLWQALAKGDFKVDAATQAQAQADIADDGYWGVDKTSDRILDFAKALAGDDPAKADQLLDAFKKGYEDATKSWGKDLPDILDAYIRTHPFG